MTNPCVLYIEDDDNDIVLLRSAFKRANIANPLQIVTDGQMAIDYLTGTGPFADRSEYPLPGLVLLDLKVPKKSGLEVLGWIRGQPSLKSVVVIILTSSPNIEDATQASELGANSFVVKPSNVKQLADFARRLKEWWLESHRFAPMKAAQRLSGNAPG